MGFNLMGLTNALNRMIPNGYIPYGTKIDKKPQIRKNVSINNQKIIQSIKDVFDIIPITDGMTLSFHHHLRNGDGVLNIVIDEVIKRGLKDISLAPSAIFPVHEPLVKAIENGQIKDIYTNYLNGPVAESIQKGMLKGMLVMDTHGGRPRAISTGELHIDVAFIAVPTSDSFGHGNGIQGQSACGTLGYAIPDLYYAKHKVVVTDNLVDKIDKIDIDGQYVDYVLNVDKIGDPKGIVSGTTKPTRDPIQLKIAKDTAKLIDELGMIKDGMSFQTGAGGTSLAVALDVKHKMIERGIKGSFASGGITNFLVDMHENGLFELLYDVQCFDLEAVESYKRNKNHLSMSSSKYGNPDEENPIVNQLDVVILGATEIDTDFNVNVTTDSNGKIIGGSGGHSDTASGAKLTIITTNLLKSRTSMIKDHVTTITTPGSTIDCLVTERGIAINPLRKDLIEKLKGSSLHIIDIHELLAISQRIAGVPMKKELSKDVIGVVRYRDGSIIDSLYKR
jgi:citrate lyase subunit alpha/citrate CoA-transferase